MALERWILAIFGVALVAAEISAAKVSCIKCTTEKDSNCARGKLEASECSQEDDKCYTRLVGGHVVRGCFADLAVVDQTSCERDGACTYCSGRSGCNDVYWPSCHTCSEAEPECANAQTDSTKARFCSEFYSDNYCYARLNNGKVSRGCGHEYPQCLGESSNCQMCYSDGCNGLAKNALTISKCYKCLSSNEECTNGTSSALSDDCTRLGDACFATIEDNQVRRGCMSFSGTDKIASCSDPDDASCVSCQGDNCNTGYWLRCHQCKVSDADKSCNDEKDDVTQATYCRNFQTDDQCYSRKVNGVFERGCRSDLGASVNPCDKLGEKECQLCVGPGCNKQRNSAGLIGVTSMVLVLGAAMAVLL